MTMSNSTIADDFQYCEDLMRSRESNFSLGFAFLPPEKKRAIHVVYAFCRFVDDISDEIRTAGVAAMLGAWKSEIQSIYGEKKSEHPIGRALVAVNERFAIPADGFIELIDGCVQDQRTKAYATFADLTVYCELVATSIAKVSLPVYGTKRYQEAFPFARDLSFAFQLTNILRDTAEDLERGRVYVPSEDLKRFGLTADVFRDGKPEAGLRELFKFEGERCEAYFASGRKVLEYLESDSHECVRVMTEAYHTLLVKILRDPIASLRGQTKLNSEDKRRITNGKIS